MGVLSEGNYLGDLVRWEEDLRFSREEVVVISGQNLKFGTVIGKIEASGKVTQLAPSASDGSEKAYGVVIDDYDASSADVNGTAVVREAELGDKAMIWPSGITAAQKAAGLADLDARMIVVRSEA